jgi:peptidoglycan/xylan/chitin deacetylase (PgdA/CDA1 family)
LKTKYPTLYSQFQFSSKPMKSIFRIVATVVALPFSAALAQPLLEPELRLTTLPNVAPRVALTFDACSGKTDERIMQTLIDNKISATIFVTARWIRRNPQAIAEIKANPDLFEIENHGAKHVPIVDFPIKIFGLQAAGSPEAVHAEIAGGATAIENAFGGKPEWFRGATGLYSASAEKTIADMDYKLAGYSIHGDGGASFSTSRTANTIAAAKDGDVIVAHINQPSKPAGAGVVEGILKLKAEGFIFIKLQDGFPSQINICNHCADSAH